MDHYSSLIWVHGFVDPLFRIRSQSSSIAQEVPPWHRAVVVFKNIGETQRKLEFTRTRNMLNLHHPFQLINSFCI